MTIFSLVIIFSILGYIFHSNSISKVIIFSAGIYSDTVLVNHGFEETMMQVPLGVHSSNN